MGEGSGGGAAAPRPGSAHLQRGGLHVAAGQQRAVPPGAHVHPEGQRLDALAVEQEGAAGGGALAELPGVHPRGAQRCSLAAGGREGAHAGEAREAAAGKREQHDMPVFPAAAPVLPSMTVAAGPQPGWGLCRAKAWRNQSLPVGNPRENAPWPGRHVQTVHAATPHLQSGRAPCPAAQPGRWAWPPTAPPPPRLQGRDQQARGLGQQSGAGIAALPPATCRKQI